LITAGSQITGAHFRRIINYGNGRMPPLPHVSDEQAGDILAFLGGGGRPRRPGDMPAGPRPEGPVVAAGGITRPPAGAPPTDSMQEYPSGVDAPAQRYFTDYGLGYPYLLAPPWSQIMAYDLNEGTIKWRKALGQDPEVAKAGGKQTGVPRGAQRQGMLVTSTGIVFSTARDGRFYAFDADSGEVLWSHQLPMYSEGIPAIYEVKGKHYIVVNATTPPTSGLFSREGGIGSTVAPGLGGYVVFALP
jgi:quinoprotein glucose dehydrogenase